MPLESATKAKHLLAMADEAMELARYAEALRYLKAAVRLDSRSPEAHTALGRAYTELGRLDEAEEALERAVRLDDDGPGHAQLAHLYRLMGRTEEAIATARKAVELRPELASGHALLGELLASQGQIDEAIEAYRAALRINPQLAQARFRLACLYIERDESTEAYGESTEAMGLHPHLAASRLKLGDLYLKRGAFDEALREYRAALEADWADVGVIQYRIGSAYFAQNRFEEAAEAFQEALKLGAERAACSYKLGIIRFSQGRYAEALEYYEAALKEFPFSSTLRFNLGETYRCLGRSEEAAAAYRAALEIDGKLEVAAHRLDLVEGRPAPLEARKPVWIPLAPTEERHALILCSGPDDERMLISASRVQRVEERMPMDVIVMHGGLPHVPYEGSLLPLIDVARVLPNKRRAARHPEYFQQALSKTTFPVMIYGEGPRRVGLVINEVHGRVDRSYVVRGGPSRPGVILTTMLDGRVAEVIDVDSIIDAATGPGPGKLVPDVVQDLNELIGSMSAQFLGD